MKKKLSFDSSLLIILGVAVAASLNLVFTIVALCKTHSLVDAFLALGFGILVAVTWTSIYYLSFSRKIIESMKPTPHELMVKRDEALANSMAKVAVNFIGRSSTETIAGTLAYFLVTEGFIDVKDYDSAQTDFESAIDSDNRWETLKQVSYKYCKTTEENRKELV